jgi:tetratricopeptide (TPR) repeat protein
MSNDKVKLPGPKGTVPAATPPPPKPPAVPRFGRVAPLFRRTDWLTFLITFGVVWIGYYLTLAPELTLEDSGELATGSFYAGIPHPPGYPVWTIYTWLWTVLLPIKSVAWRVALGEATGGALAAGLLGLLVSRGSSLLIEGIEDLKSMAGQWEVAICMVSGFVAGMLLGFNGFMWSQSVIVEVYSFSLASLVVVLLCLLRWIYAPHQRRYLYYALFFHGICFTNHQTLIVAAIGIEVAIAAADFRMGRYLFLGDSIIYLCGLILKSQHILTALENNYAIFVIFNVVGILSIAAYVWFTLLSRESFPEFCLDGCLAGFFLFLASIPVSGFFAVLALGALCGIFYFAINTWRLGNEWLVVILCGLCWIAGAGFYFYMPLAGMTNPPMEWGYPRTVEGFIHAFTRGQYEKTNPTNIIGDPMRFITQLMMLASGIKEEFNWVYAFLALVPFLFFRKLHRRERAWLIGLGGIYLCLGVLLLILLNPPPDKAAQQLVRVFFTASHVLIALMVGYGLTLIATFMATHYTRFRFWGLIGGGVAMVLALISFTELTQDTFFGQSSTLDLPKLISFVVQCFTNKDQYGLPVYAGLMLIGMVALYLVGLLIYRDRAPLAITLVIFALMPLHSIMTHWSDNEQRDHWFGYWFGHDMFTPTIADKTGKPLYPEMTKDAVLFGGTDPGRFCPTYMIFCDSFIPHDCQPIEDQKFDRRDVYIITQNALADGTYLQYIRAQYNRSAEKDVPFFQELFRSDKERQENYSTNFLARAVSPLDDYFLGLGDRIEKRRRTYTSWFTPKDFVDLPGFTSRLSPAGPSQDPVSKFIYDNLTQETRGLLASRSNPDALRQALADDLNRLLDRELQAKRSLTRKNSEKFTVDQDISGGSSSESLRQRQQQLEKEIAELSKVSPLYDPERFKQVAISEYLADFIKENPQSQTRVRLNRLLLEAAYPKEIAKSLGGVYPDREIYTPSPEDSQRCFQDYLQDAQRRLQLNQLKPGEDVKLIDNRVQVSGQIAVMSINGLLTKVIFDHNPKNEFFVEESFPLDWMYPYLTPYGIIMKINRQPLPELTEEIVNRDHEFWTRYSERLVGNWITYDTSVKQIAEFVEKVYLRHDFTGFKGDRKFIRDDQAQKAFSKLRSSIGGIYAWRVTDPNNRNPATQQRMIKEADFTFRQSFAFCPYSPEAVFRYVNLLLSLSRLDDALIVASTCQKLDPYNAQVQDLVSKLQSFRKDRGDMAAAQQAFQQNLVQLEKAAKDNPSNIQAAFNLASAYLQVQQTNQALAVLDRVVESPQVNAGAIVEIARLYASIGNLTKLEGTLEKLVQVAPTSPEAWYDLGGLKVQLRMNQEALPAIAKALELSAERLAKDPKQSNLLATIQKDPKFDPIRKLPEFQQLFSPK